MPCFLRMMQLDSRSMKNIHEHIAPRNLWWWSAGVQWGAICV